MLALATLRFIRNNIKLISNKLISMKLITMWPNREINVQIYPQSENRKSEKVKDKARIPEMQKSQKSRNAERVKDR